MRRFIQHLVRLFLKIAPALTISGVLHAQTLPLTVVAAENFYGDVAKQLGGQHVDVTSILNNPDQDPHLFEASPRTARLLAHATLVIYNGANYDPWMTKLLDAAPNKRRAVIIAAELLDKKSGDNPHLWYQPATMPAVARAIHAALIAADPAHRIDYDAKLTVFLNSLAPINAAIAKLSKRYAGLSISATEPVFGYMAEAIGLSMRNQRFQLAIMNNTEVSASDIAAFEKDLREKRIHLLIYNSQANGVLTQRMLDLARRSQIPTLSVTETQPADLTFQQWMLTQLNALSAALEGQHP